VPLGLVAACWSVIRARSIEFLQGAAAPKSSCGALMDRATHLQHLEQAERHVAQGERHIASQELIVSDTTRLGRDTTEARKLLDNFYTSQAQHIQHRDRLRRELEGPYPARKLCSLLNKSGR
jgi:hypothetical protein